MRETLYKGGKAAIIAECKSFGSVWVAGSLKRVVEKMCDAGEVEFSAMAVCDNNTSRSTEQYFVHLK